MTSAQGPRSGLSSSLTATSKRKQVCTPKWVPGAHVGDTSGRDPAEHSQAAGGTFFPSLLESRKRSEKGPLAVVQTAYVMGRAPAK